MSSDCLPITSHAIKQILRQISQRKEKNLPLMHWLFAIAFVCLVSSHMWDVRRCTSSIRVKREWWKWVSERSYLINLFASFSSSCSHSRSQKFYWLISHHFFLLAAIIIVMSHVLLLLLHNMCCIFSSLLLTWLDFQLLCCVA